MKKTEWHIGCSGFHYKHWKKNFYPEDLPQRKWFEYYCEHFKTVELNVTFYRFPQLSFLQGWYTRSPGDFVFSVKAPRIITHFKKFTGTQQLIADFYHVIQNGLQEKLGPVLFQLPPRTSFTQERLENIINSLDTSFNNVLEFRHETWWKKEVYQQLAAHNISFCGMSHPALPRDVILNTAICYYRFHGIPQLYKSPYSKPELKAFAEKIKNSRKTKKAFVYFNNDIDEAAIDNAGTLIQLINN